MATAQNNADNIADQTTAPDRQQDKHTPKLARSSGNIKLDMALWGGIQGVGIWLFSLVVADWAQSGKGFLNKGFEAGRTWLTPRLGKFAENKTSQKIWGSSKEQWASSIVLTLALSLGGTILLPVTKYFEDRRTQIATWIDKKLGHDDIDPSQIRPEPKQTWGSMIKGRLMSLGLGYAIFAALGPRRAGNVQNAVGDVATNAILKVRPNANSQTIRKWSDLAVFDLILTTLTAGTAYVGSRFSASKHMEQKSSVAEAVSQSAATGETVIIPPHDESAHIPVEPKTTRIPQPQSSWQQGQEMRKQAATTATAVVIP